MNLFYAILCFIYPPKREKKTVTFKILKQKLTDCKGHRYSVFFQFCV